MPKSLHDPAEDPGSVPSTHAGWLAAIRRESKEMIVTIHHTLEVC